METNNKKESFRGNLISMEFCKRFKDSKFFKDLYSKHLNELIIGVRDGYINLYITIATVSQKYLPPQRL